MTETGSESKFTRFVSSIKTRLPFLQHPPRAIEHRPQIEPPSEGVFFEEFQNFLEQGDPKILPIIAKDKSSRDIVTEPYQFTPEETETIRSALQIEEEALQERLKKISALCQMFERYLLNGLVVPEGCKIRFYSLGCGSDGALDAYAIQLAAKRQNVQAEAICVDENSMRIWDVVGRPFSFSYLEESAEEWERFAKNGLVEKEAAVFIQAPAQSIDFSQGEGSQNPLLVLVRNVDPMQSDKILHLVSIKVFPIMERLRDRGSDGRFMVTSENKSTLDWKHSYFNPHTIRGYREGMRLLRAPVRFPFLGPFGDAARVVTFNGEPISLGYLNLNEENPTPTSDCRVRWDDKYVTVIGYNH